jgi:gas vesicle protein
LLPFELWVHFDEGTTMKRVAMLTAVAGALALALAGCEKQEGTGEQVGEEIDEAVDAAKDGGESTADRVDDAIDEAREDVKDAAEDAKN